MESKTEEKIRAQAMAFLRKFLSKEFGTIPEPIGIQVCRAIKFLSHKKPYMRVPCFLCSSSFLAGTLTLSAVALTASRA